MFEMKSEGIKEYQPSNPTYRGSSSRRKQNFPSDLFKKLNNYEK